MSGMYLLPLSACLSNDRSKSTVFSKAPMPRMFRKPHLRMHFNVRDKCSGAVIIRQFADMMFGKLSARQSDCARVLLPSVIYNMLSCAIP